MSDMLNWLRGHAGVVQGNFIGGEWRTPKQNRSKIYNPGLRDQCLGEFTDSDENDVGEAVCSAHEAWLSWRNVPGPDRGAILFRAADLLEQRLDEIAFVLAAEQGKVLSEARGEVSRAAKEMRFCAGEASRIDGDVLPSEKRNGLAMTMREPIGVVAAIGPWNFPVVTPVRKIAPALAYGCSVVLKPSNLTPWSATKLMDVFKDAGVPNGVVSLVFGSGRIVGEALIRHKLIKGVSFTGSTGVGATINTEASKSFVRTQLELGGKNAAVIFDYASAEVLAKQISAAAFQCTGQRCTAISRIVVLKDRADEITEAIQAELAAIKVGPAWEAGATMGPMITADHKSSVMKYIDIGKNEGAKLAFGGSSLESGELTQGHFVEPTLFTDVTPGSRLALEEMFGPVLSVIKVSSIDEAFNVANEVDYGLAASVYTRDVDLALRFTRESQTGMVHVNHGTASEAHMPFGGVKASGFGAYSIGHSNQDFFTTMKSVYFQG
ncbi:aldehyde dehydrogenase family protein [Paenochrobactrum pullorum]|uniref:aldehyde dehydrogenase family protein n=1 Tax=Paenochrobactrum pullorum TaxID=1324351 RepID=UPI0035BB9EAC